MLCVQIFPVSTSISYLLHKQSELWRQMSPTLARWIFQTHFSAFTSGPRWESAPPLTDESAFILGAPASASPPACALPLPSDYSLPQWRHARTREASWPITAAVGTKEGPISGRRLTPGSFITPFTPPHPPPNIFFSTTTCSSRSSKTTLKGTDG